mgnify:CR=1 FL=1
MKKLFSIIILLTVSLTTINNAFSISPDVLLFISMSYKYLAAVTFVVVFEFIVKKESCFFVTFKNISNASR